MKRVRRTEKTVTKAILESRGLVSTAAQSLGVSRGTLYADLNKYPKAQEALDGAREYTLDKAESRLFDAMERGEAWAIRMVLMTLGRSRGYVEKTVNEVVPMHREIIVNMVPMSD